MLKFSIGYDAAKDDDELMLLSERVGENALELLENSSTSWIELFPICTSSA